MLFCLQLELQYIYTLALLTLDLGDSDKLDTKNVIALAVISNWIPVPLQTRMRVVIWMRPVILLWQQTWIRVLILLRTVIHLQQNARQFLLQNALK